jgi:hypothetical protein
MIWLFLTTFFLHLFGQSAVPPLNPVPPHKTVPLPESFIVRYKPPTFLYTLSTLNEVLKAQVSGELDIKALARDASYLTYSLVKDPCSYQLFFSKYQSHLMETSAMYTISLISQNDAFLIHIDKNLPSHHPDKIIVYKMSLKQKFQDLEAQLSKDPSLSPELLDIIRKQAVILSSVRITECLQLEANIKIHGPGIEVRSDCFDIPNFDFKIYFDPQKQNAHFTLTLPESKISVKGTTPVTGDSYTVSARYKVGKETHIELSRQCPTQSPTCENWMSLSVAF